MPPKQCQQRGGGMWPPLADDHLPMSANPTASLPILGTYLPELQDATAPNLS